jgi:hypothetical protein
MTVRQPRYGNEIYESQICSQVEKENYSGIVGTIKAMR